MKNIILVVFLFSTFSFGQTTWSKIFDDGMLRAIVQNQDSSYTYVASKYITTISYSGEFISRYEFYREGKSNVYIGSDINIYSSSSNGHLLWASQGIMLLDSLGEITNFKANKNYKSSYISVIPRNDNFLVLELNNENNFTFYSLSTSWDSTYLFTHEQDNYDWLFNGYTTLLNDDDGGISLCVSQGNNITIIKWDSDYNLIWKKSYADISPSKKIIHSSEGGYFILWNESPWISGYNIIKLDNHGSILWQKNYDPPGNANCDLVNAHLKSSADIAVSYIYSNEDKLSFPQDYAVDVISQEGELISSEVYEAGGGDILTSSILDISGGIILAGYSYSFWPYNPVSWIIKTDSLGKAMITSIKNEIVEKKYILSQNYPNPFNPSTIINYTIPNGNNVSTFTRLNVFNILGKEVATLVNEKQSPGNYQVKFDGTDLPSGVYFYRLQTGDFLETKKWFC